MLIKSQRGRGEIMSKSVLANKIGYLLFKVAKENNTLEEVSYELKEVTKVS